MKNSLKWAAIGLALVLPGACRLESPPVPLPAFEQACEVYCDRSEDCLENYDAEVCTFVCVSLLAGQECDVDDAKLGQCLADMEAMTCEEVADFDLPEICFDACGDV